MDDFIRFLRTLRKSENTIKVYCRAVKSFLAFSDTISKNQIQKFVDTLSNSGKNSVTIRTYLYGILLYNRFLENDSIPACNINVPKIVSREASYIDKKFFSETVGCISDSLIKDLFLVLFYTGVRISELFGYTKNNIVHQDNFYYLQIVGKGNKERSIPLTEEIKDILVKESFIKFKNNISYYHVLKYIRRFFGKDYTPHSFRHGYVTMLVNSGVDQRSIKNVSGHESFLTTLRYFHTNKETTSKSVLLAINKE